MKTTYPEMRAIIESAREDGWILEPDAKRLFSLAGLTVPRFALVQTPQEALCFAQEIGYPLVAKIVSPRVIHKADVGGVVVGIASEARLVDVCRRFQSFEGFRGILVEEMVGGVELILGAKTDLQFGPIILLGIGGTGVEIYRDVVMLMAPLSEKDASLMYKGLTGHQFLEGYRGAKPVALEKLTQTLLTFSHIVMELEGLFDSIDINPLLCSSRDCIVADARVILGNTTKTINSSP